MNTPTAYVKELKLHQLTHWFGLEGRLALIGWLGYMGWMVVYCIIHQMTTTNRGLDVWGSLEWTFREWGFWILITPTLAGSLSKACHYSNPLVVRCVMIGAALLIASVYRIALSYYQGADNAFAALIQYLPQYIQLIGLICLGWLAIHQGRNIFNFRNNDTLPAASLNKILVSTGGSETFININDICALQAAGNYVEIHTATQSYLLRSSLKGVLQTLPDDQFLRCHRSAAVNINSVQRIHYFPAGHGEMQLCCGRKVPVAKSYRSDIKRFKPTV